MNSFARYKALLTVYLHGSGALTSLFGKKKPVANALEEKPSKKIFSSVLAAVGTLCMLVYSVIATVGLAISAAEGGFVQQAAYSLFGLQQICILFLGGTVMITYLYFSNDTSLLLGLPITVRETYAARFTVSYLSQLALAAFFLPAIIGFGITLQIVGYPIDAWYYVTAVLSVLVMPAVPCFAIALISAPLLYLASFMKNKNTMRAILSILASLLSLAVYLIVCLPQLQSDGTEATSATFDFIRSASKFFIYNYSLCESLFGRLPYLHLPLYFAESIATVAAAVLICSLLYKRTLTAFNESRSLSKRKGRSKDTLHRESIQKSLFKKDLKLVFANPMLCVSTFIGAIFVPIFIVMFDGMFDDSFDELSVYFVEMLNISLITFLSLIMLTASNSVTAVSVSLEARNFGNLKALPVSGKDVVLSKMKVACICNGLPAAAFAVTFSVVKRTVPILIPFGFLIAVALFFYGVGLSAYELYTDLKKPRFKFNSINELTNNNKKTIGPTLLTILIGLIVMTVGIVLSLTVKEAVVAYIGFFIPLGAISVAMAVFGMKKLLKNCEELYQKTEIS